MVILEITTDCIILNRTLSILLYIFRFLAQFEGHFIKYYWSKMNRLGVICLFWKLWRLQKLFIFKTRIITIKQCIGRKCLWFTRHIIKVSKTARLLYKLLNITNSIFLIERNNYFISDKRRNILHYFFWFIASKGFHKIFKKLLLYIKTIKNELKLTVDTKYLNQVWTVCIWQVVGSEENFLWDVFSNKIKCR